MDKKNRSLDQLTAAVERLLAMPPIPPIPAIPAIPAIPPIIISDDHNLLIKLDGKVDSLKDDIKSLADGTATTIADHEHRLRDNERTIVQIKTYGTALVILSGIITTLIIKFILK